MILNQSITIRNRRQAAHLLADKLSAYKNSNAIVVAIPYGGVPVGYQLAKELHLQFDVVPCKKIGHPADSKKSIGSVSVDEVVINEGVEDIPCDYICHQIILNQNALKAQQIFFNTNTAPLDVKGKTIILVDDVLSNADTVMACLKSIKKHQPEKIIVAAPVATQEAASQLYFKAGDLVLLSVDNNMRAETFYEEHLHIKDEEVRDLILKAMKEFNQG
jgi:putative phosphoribosyl transferase